MPDIIEGLTIGEWANRCEKLEAKLDAIKGALEKADLVYTFYGGSVAYHDMARRITLILREENTMTGQEDIATQAQIAMDNAQAEELEAENDRQLMALSKELSDAHDRLVKSGLVEWRKWFDTNGNLKRKKGE